MYMLQRNKHDLGISPQSSDSMQSGTNERKIKLDQKLIGFACILWLKYEKNTVQIISTHANCICENGFE